MDFCVRNAHREGWGHGRYSAGFIFVFECSWGRVVAYQRRVYTVIVFPGPLLALYVR